MTTVLVSLISIVSVIVGALLNHLLTRSGQMRERILEERKQEGRDLITAITEHYDAALHLAPLKILKVPVKAEDQKMLDDARRRALRTLRDRIYLASDVKKGNLLKRWINAFNAFNDSEDSDDNDEITAFVSEYEAICDLIVKAAMKGA
jgi:hypothetical protein